MQVQRFAADVEPAMIAEVLAVDGCAVVEHLVNPTVMDRLAEEMAPWMEATSPGPDDFSGHSTRRTGGLLARSETSRALIQHPTVRGAVDLVLGDATSYQLHLTQLIAVGPGESAQDIHRDQWAFDFFPFPSGYEVQCNTLWAMTDFTEANGATRVIPGSNHFEDRQRFTEVDTIPAEMPKGSVLFYTGTLYHGRGANRSEQVRCGVNITYSVAWLRQEENQYLTVPVETARIFDEDLQRLMGYGRGAYALGYIDDLRDPIEVLRPDAGRIGFGDVSSGELSRRIG
ncbi:MAG: phytanoyl-CoA dioxygenase family protein [Acidimicrobiales bacterium]|nr:phytanoyl-CoA dioxygenase family protein [Acidimicrobiales bacterium]